MKTPFLIIAAILAHSTLSSAVLAQAPGATPAAAAKKSAPLSSSDKQLVKKAGEAQLGVIHLGEMMKWNDGQGGEPVKTLGKGALEETSKAWGELGEVAQNRGAELPKTEQSASEKKDIAEMKKLAAEKFDKAYLKAFSKEAKKMASVYGEGAKSAGDADLRAHFAKWQPAASKINDDAAAAENAADKKK